VAVAVPRARGKVTIEVSRELRDRIRELSQKYGVLYDNLLFEALDLYTQSKEGLITQSNTQSKVQQGDALTPIQVRKRDHMWWTIRAGEGWDAVETDLNMIQITKLCQARLLVREVCEKVEGATRTR
jgi:predicted DNA-binding protein